MCPIRRHSANPVMEFPYSIIRAAQFAESTEAITASLTVGDEVRVPDALIQPIAT
jgi:hypothetical protein